MGIYVNPENMSKEDWLSENGEIVSPALTRITEDKCLVCLVNNGPFTAAAVCDSKEEMFAFSAQDDHRPKIWFQVNKKDLESVAQ